jgi:hypothetical protein
MNVGIYNFDEPRHPRKIELPKDSNNNNDQKQFVLTLSEAEHNEVCRDDEAYLALVLRVSSKE